MEQTQTDDTPREAWLKILNLVAEIDPSLALASLARRQNDHQQSEVVVLQQADQMIGAWGDLRPLLTEALGSACPPSLKEEIERFERQAGELRDAIEKSPTWNREKRYCRHRREFDKLADTCYDYLPVEAQAVFLAHMDAAMGVLRSAPTPAEQDADLATE